MYQRNQVSTLVQRLVEDTVWTMQIIVGPGQTGKSTMIAQALSAADVISHYVSADDAANPNESWIEREWQVARGMTRNGSRKVVLCIDEVQKVSGWARQVKSRFDRDRDERNACPRVPGSHRPRSS